MEKKKIFIIIGVCLAIILILAGSTYAYYRGVLFNDFTSTTITHGLDYYINYTKGQDITSGTLTLSNDYTGGISTDVELWKIDNTYDIYGHIYLDVNEIGENLSASTALKYAVVNNDTVLYAGGLKNYTTGESILLGANIPLQTSKQLYTVYVWLDQGQNIDVAIENENLSLSVRCEATMKEISVPVNAVSFITNLYDNSSKNIVLNNNIEYNYANSVSLMNDRFGGITSDYDAGNIRYYGANANNYIDIGEIYKEGYVGNNWQKLEFSSAEECYSYLDCSTNYSEMGFADAKTCYNELPLILEEGFGVSTVDEVCGPTIPAGTTALYRIIGLFKNIKLADGTTKDLIKVVREDSIGNLAWNDNNSIKWSDSSLRKILNNEYYNSGTINHKYLDITTGSLKNEIKDFSDIGPTNLVKNKIEAVVWNLGASNATEIYSNEMYQNERSNTKYYYASGNIIYEGTTWMGNIALMYPSDYGYSVDFNNCNVNLASYDSCSDNSWILANAWTLTVFPDSPDAMDWGPFAICEGASGFVYSITGLPVHPSFYLNADLMIVSGDGSKENPYVVK